MRRDKLVVVVGNDTILGRIGNHYRCAFSWTFNHADRGNHCKVTLELQPPAPSGANGKRKVHPNSLANIEKHKWPKGVSGHPGGRYKGVSRAYMRLMQEKDPKTGLTHEELIAKNMILVAESPANRNTVAAAKELRQSTEETEEAGKGGLNVGNLSVNILAMMQKLAISE